MKVFKLPQELQDLREVGMWQATEECPLNLKLKQEFGWKLGVQLIDDIEFETDGLKSVAKDSAINNLYGVYLTGQKKDYKNLDWIDANKIKAIGFTWDEDSICLDFRFSDTEPRILASYSDLNTRRQEIRWKEVALDINDFILQLGIS